MNKLRELMNIQGNMNENSSDSEKSSDSNSESDGESGAESEINVLIGQQTANETKTKVTILKLQAMDMKNVLKTVKKMNNEVSIGYAHAQLEILKTSWNDFRVTLYELRGASVAIDGVINYTKLLGEFASALGKLNDITHQQKNKQSTNIKLPEIKLPQFDGSSTTWKTYIELFNKIVHGNESEQSN